MHPFTKIKLQGASLVKIHWLLFSRNFWQYLHYSRRLLHF